MNKPHDISLLEAACNGNLETVKNLVETNQVCINIHDGGFRTPLHLASGNRHLKVVKYLIARDSQSINAVDQYKDTPLHYAARSAYLELVKFLIQKGSNINAINISEDTPLDEAIKQFQTPEGRTERYQEYRNVIEWLKENGATFNNAMNPYPF